MIITCLDLEGVLVPEIWIAVAEKTRIAELRLTTRDLPDYDELMRRRIKILREHGIKLKDVQSVIAGIRPLPGARAFLDSLRAQHQVIVLSDTFYEFAGPLMEKLGFPTIFCNGLETDRKGFISGYRLRQRDGKRKSVLALKSLNFRTHAAGDSYNDVTMLQAAHRGVFFNPPAKIAAQFPKFPVTKSYPALLKALTAPSR
jgi:phosphoserine/homoserine phosphotransferase